jgi:type I restriction enzyme, S subunit
MKKQVAHEEPDATQPAIDIPEPPEGWARTRMGDIADVGGGGTPKASDPENFSDEGYPWVTPADLGGFSGMYIQRGRRSLSEKGLRHSSAQLMPTGTVLMSSRAPIGYVAIAANEISTNQGFKSFIVHKDILPEYVFYWLKFLRPSLEEFGSGSTFAEISGSRAREIPILIAPSAEQKRIVARLEEVLARVNATRERFAKVPAILKHFRQAVLAAACTGRLTEDWRKGQHCLVSAVDTFERVQGKRESAYELSLKEYKKGRQKRPFKPTCLGEYELAWELKSGELPEQWLCVPLGKVCLKVTDGTHDTPKPVPSGIPFITAKHIRDRFIDFENALFLHKAIHDSIYARCNAVKGDVVMVNIGAGTATPALVRVEHEFSMKNVALLKPDPEILDGRYLELYQLYVKPMIIELITRGGAQPFMGLDLIKTIPSVVPPLAEQIEIVRRVEALFKLIDTIENRVAAGTRMAERLTQTILTKAFRGELVATEAELACSEVRPYESAAELLRRLKTDRESSVRPASSIRTKNRVSA